MRVLIVKLSSMGDLIQALPALSDAQKHHPDIRFDWVVDESFAQIPHWHPAVDKVIHSAHRRWRKGLFSKAVWQDIKRFWHELRATHYDYVVDAQSNLKSAAVMLASIGEKHGPDRDSVREFGAQWSYQHKHHVPKQLLAVDRWRQLFASTLGYELTSNTSTLDFGLSDHDFVFPSLDHCEPVIPAAAQPYLVFVQNASWPSKCWTQEHWRQLIDRAKEAGFRVVIPWGNQAEKNAAKLIAEGKGNTYVLPRLSLNDIASVLKHSAGSVCMDTGLAHISAALETPTVTLYGPTDKALIGATGENSVHITAEGFDCMPCYKRNCHINGDGEPHAACLKSINAERCWTALKKII